jgi:hypothetical protein
MAKVDKLTPAQEKEMEEYRDKWHKIGRSTEIADKERAESALCGMYQEIDQERPQFLWARSPKEAVLFIACLRLDIITLDQAKWVSSESWGVPSGETYTAKKPVSNVEWFVESYKGLMEMLGLSYEEGIDHLREPVRVALNDALTWFGSNGAYWVGFYDFMGTLIKYKPEDARKLAHHIALSESAFWVWPYVGLCVVCDRPNALHWSEGPIENKVIHKDGAPAIQFRDNAALWVLNGVRVPKWLSETTESQLDPARIKDVENVEVRREFVRKVGIERLCKALNAREIASESPVIDGKAIRYRLLEMEIGADMLRYLEMENPSLEGIIHVERVDSDCETVRDAIVFRNGFEHVEFTEEGQDWYQHGDVVLVPKGATRLKPWPSWIA